MRLATKIVSNSIEDFLCIDFNETDSWDAPWSVLIQSVKCIVRNMSYTIE